VKILQTFKNGRSNSVVHLAIVNDITGVYKTNIKNVEEIVQKWESLPFDKPKIYFHTANSLFMEYIPGTSIKQYLANATINDVDHLVSFISSYIDFCKKSSKATFNYNDLIIDRVESTYKSLLPVGTTFNFNTLLPKSITHGDFTLDNILYYNNKFYLIDISHSIWDSIYFDINKLRQDLTGLWFIRDEKIKQNWKIHCDYIYNQLDTKYPGLFDNEIYKLMITRILPYSKIEKETEFLIREIERLNANNNTLCGPQQ
jgi:hypothetical protein